MPGRLTDQWFGARARTLARTAALLTAGLVISALTLAGCGASSPTPGPTLRAFLVAWSDARWAAMRARVNAPPKDFSSVNAQVFAALGVSRAEITAGHVNTAKSGTTATARYQRALPTPGRRRCLVGHQHGPPGQASQPVAAEVDAGDDRPGAAERRHHRRRSRVADPGPDPRSRGCQAHNGAPAGGCGGGRPAHQTAQGGA